MKKITIAILMLLGSFSMASAELGVNIGISSNIGIFHATGKDTHADVTRSQTEDAVGVDTFTSVFLEKDLSFLPGALGERLAVGISYVPDALSTDKVENDRFSLDAGGSTSSTKTNTVQVDFDDLTTLYATLNLTDSIYVKGGMMQVDVKTNEKLGTGSKYGNFTLDGSVVGVGFNKDFGPGLFLRGETTFMSFDDKKLKSLDNTIEMKGLEGAAATVAIGKSF